MSAVTTVELRCDDCGRRPGCRCRRPPASSAFEAREHATTHLHWVVMTATDPVQDVVDICPSCQTRRRDKAYQDGAP